MATVDLQLFGPNGFLFDEAAWGPALVSGPDAVAQRFLYYLFLPAGTVPGRPDDGTGFTDAVLTFRSEFELFAAFAAAEPAAARGVRSAERDDDPPSDRYGAARLADIRISAEQLTLTFTVRAADGSAPALPVTFVTDL